MRAIAYILSAVTAVLVSACGGNNTETDQMGPEETIEAFNRAITAGDFTTAETLCDTASMKIYLDSYKEAWNTISTEDSCALSIASSILYGSVMNITETKKEDDKRIIIYTLEADGHKKERRASVRKEGERWKVESITDMI